MILSRFLLFFVMIHDVKERPQDESHPPQPRQLIAPSIRNYLPLRSPLSSGEGSLWLHLYGKLCKTDAHIKPSPLERGDRGAVGEIYHTDALSPKRIADATHLKKPPRKNVVAKIISPLISQPDASVFFLCA